MVEPTSKFRVTVAQRTAGVRVVAGTEWPIIDRVERHGPRQWVAVRGLCNGTPDGATTYPTMRGALDALGLTLGQRA